MAERRKGYTREFKLDALRLIDQGRSVAEVARNLGVHVNTLHGWRQQMETRSSQAFCPQICPRLSVTIWHATRRRDISATDGF